LCIDILEEWTAFIFRLEVRIRQGTSANLTQGREDRGAECSPVAVKKCPVQDVQGKTGSVEKECGAESSLGASRGAISSPHFSPEDGGIMFLQNVIIPLKSYIVQHPKKTTIVAYVP
jgi:hypothetical protein